MSVGLTLREKLELAGYRLRSLAAHMPTDWQRDIALRWADDAVRASGMEARQGGDVKQAPSRSDDSPTAKGGGAQKPGDR